MLKIGHQNPLGNASPAAPPYNPAAMLAARIAQRSGVPVAVVTAHLAVAGLGLEIR